MDFCETKPDYIWTVSKVNWNGTTKVGWTNGGNIASTSTWTWTAPYGTGVQTYATRIAVSATDEKVAVITPGNGKPNKYTINGGTSWTDCVGLPTGVMPRGSVYDNTYPLEADKKNGNKFYCYHTRNNGEFYRSDNKGQNWTLVNTDIPAWGPGAGTPYCVRVAAAPSVEGTVWVALGENGLYKSTNSGVNFSQVTYFTKASLVDFGANKPGNTNSTVYVHGKNSSGQWGVFRSTDMGTNWILITPADKPFAKPTVIEACRKVYGRVFIADEATGISYGIITSDTQAPTVPAGLASSSVTSASFTLSWTASTDNIGVTAYEVFKGGVSVGTTASTSMNITGITASNTYAMTV
jgi:hypothetical protein